MYHHRYSFNIYSGSYSSLPPFLFTYERLRCYPYESRDQIIHWSSQGRSFYSEVSALYEALYEVSAYTTQLAYVWHTTLPCKHSTSQYTTVHYGTLEHGDTQGKITQHSKLHGDKMSRMNFYGDRTWKIERLLALNCQCRVKCIQ